HEGGASPLDVPVVVGKMVKARFRDRSPARMGTIAHDTLEGHRQVERRSGRLAAPGGDDARVPLAMRYANRALMRMGGKVLDDAVDRIGVQQKLMDGLDRRDRLKLA